MQARHGGDIYRHEVKIDFSVNINPLGIEEHVKNAIVNVVTQCDQYPDLECDALRAAIAEHIGVKLNQVVCGNGASELFLAITRWIMPKKALLLAPSFSGYEHALNTIDCNISYAKLLEKNHFQVTEEVLADFTENLDIAFLCSPNNPTGALIQPEILDRIIRYCEEHQIYLVLDQCFLEFTGKYKEFGAEKYLSHTQYLIIVNAFTKTFAIPGIRLGYACSTEDNILAIKKQLPEWNVSIPAMAAGIAALKSYQLPHPQYMERAVNLLNTEREYLQNALQQLHIKTYPSSADYILLQTKMPLYDLLLEKGILIRHCNNYEGLSQDYYRIAIKDHQKNERLVQTIMEIIREQEI